MNRSLASKTKAANAALIVDGNLDAIAEFFTPDCVAHLADEDLTGGHAAIRKVGRRYQRAFANLQVEVEILVQAKDRVPWQRTVRGIHRQLPGFPGNRSPDGVARHGDEPVPRRLDRGGVGNLRSCRAASAGAETSLMARETREMRLREDRCSRVRPRSLPRQ